MNFSQYLENITGISIYPLISLSIFVAFFLSVTIWAFRIDKNEISKIENLPFEEK